VAVQGEDRGGRLVLRFEATASGADAELRGALNQLMAGFALAWELD
jgi:hypothetical protein